MEIIRGLKKIPNLSLALGYFDGVHKGHQAVIKSAVDYAKDRNEKSAVITFSESPASQISGIPLKTITTRENKYQLFQELGLDYIIELNFKEISFLNGEEYLEKILYNYFSPINISTGFNHHFGENKTGNCDTLERYKIKYKYNYNKIPAEKLGEEIISSSAIRGYLESGNIEKANKMLGRNFSVKGKVIEGNKIGRTIGFPTANILYPEEVIQIPFGVYSTDINIDKRYKGIANYGIKPTISNTKIPILENHIFDYNKDIYGENVEVILKKQIRPEKRFNNLEELQKQIQQDIKSA